MSTPLPNGGTPNEVSRRTLLQEKASAFALGALLAFVGTGYVFQSKVSYTPETGTAPSCTEEPQVAPSSSASASVETSNSVNTPESDDGKEREAEAPRYLAPFEFQIEAQKAQAIEQQIWLEYSASESEEPVEAKAEESPKPTKELVRPERIWPNPRLFDNVSTEEIERFADMTTSQFFEWRNNHWLRKYFIDDSILQAFARAAEGELADHWCQYALSNDANRAELEEAIGNLPELCEAGAAYLGDDEKPLRKVLEERRNQSK